MVHSPKETLEMEDMLCFHRPTLWSVCGFLSVTLDVSLSCTHHHECDGWQLLLVYCVSLSPENVSHFVQRWWWSLSRSSPWFPLTHWPAGGATVRRVEMDLDSFKYAASSGPLRLTEIMWGLIRCPAATNNSWGGMWQGLITNNADTRHILISKVTPAERQICSLFSSGTPRHISTHSMVCVIVVRLQIRNVYI